MAGMRARIAGKQRPDLSCPDPVEKARAQHAAAEPALAGDDQHASRSQSALGQEKSREFAKGGVLGVTMKIETRLDLELAATHRPMIGDIGKRTWTCRCARRRSMRLRSGSRRVRGWACGDPLGRRRVDLGKSASGGRADRASDNCPRPAIMIRETAVHHEGSVVAGDVRSGRSGDLVKQPVGTGAFDRALERPDILGGAQIFAIGEFGLERHGDAREVIGCDGR